MHVSSHTKFPGRPDTRLVKVNGKTIGLLVLQDDGTIRVPRLQNKIFGSRVEAVDALLQNAGIVR